MLWNRLFGFFFDADEGAGSGGDAGDKSADDKTNDKSDEKSNADGSGNPGSDPNGAGDSGKTFTQADVDALLEKRLARQEKKITTDLKAAQDKEKFGETERLKADRDEADKKVTDAISRANARILTAEAKSAAAAAGIKPERLDYAVKLADLGEIEVDDDGKVDTKAIAAAIKQVVTDLPELMGGTAGAGGSEFTKTSPGDKALTWDYIGDMPDEERIRRQDEIGRWAKNNRKK